MDGNSNMKNEKAFICGVVEGFYGRPWTTEQRKDLFAKLKKWGMNSYVYAPKDDYKHRAYWRELYTVEEADHLTSLIAAAKEHEINFYYALSPGLDMTYSNAKETATLKRKLEQVSQFGCEAFALLFDDIEPEMTKADKEVFQSFAHAQVSVTNEIFNHLNCPRFLFCPTQYCSSRAVPSVPRSEYLNTIGSKLAQDIEILWTGPRVVSKFLTVEGIQEITEVLRRPPVIWDNLHANDYCSKRLFLGPYSGRSPKLIPLLKGVLTNPNCEFHANSVAIHTLAHWSKCTTEANIDNAISADIKLETEGDQGGFGDDMAPNCMAKNIYHPREALKNAIQDWLPEFTIEKEAWGPITKPHPPVTMVMPIIPIIPSVNTCMSLTTPTTATVTCTQTMKVPEVNTTQLQALAEVCSTVTGAETIQPLPNVVMNSLVSAKKIVTNDTIPNPIVSNLTIPDKIPVPCIQAPIMSIKDSSSVLVFSGDSGGEGKDGEGAKVEIIEPIEEDITEKDEMVEKEVESVVVAEDGKNAAPGAPETEAGTEVMAIADENPSPHSTTEPMECGSSVLSSSPKQKSSSEDVVMSESVSTSSGSMHVETSDGSLNSNVELGEDVSKELSNEDLSFLCDLFYLPFEHGSKGLVILNEFHWLKSNASVLLGAPKKPQQDGAVKPEVQEWLQRSEKFSTLCQSIHILAKKFSVCVNKELVYDLFSYVWDIAGIVSLLNAFVKWLALAHFPSNINSYTQGSYTWFSKGWKDTFMSGEQEPWVFRGGLTADLQRLLPVDSGNDLFLYKLPDTPSSNFYTVRPYVFTDEEAVYSICHKTCRDGSDCSELFPENLQGIPADRLVGPFITINPEFCMVMECGTLGIIGYICGALDAKVFYKNQQMCWLPAMCLKYPIELLESPDLTPTAKDSINHFHNFKYDCPQDVLNTYPSMMTCCVLKEQLTHDPSVAKRLVIVLLAAFRSNGSFGVHVCINRTDRYMHQFYTKLGFTEILQDNMRIYLGRNF
ncbi:protein O-GlcNAcase isoform X1 [Lutzomyia longipalpis]|uniref:protein O-GlcNAcase isoform X1 n=1 Tax=Lutzomyia longipalpis TaxID=7200 RepID=UPI00248444F0|nr:protein O-GlcNAcase isoform X1 [Lutzomyia longipalpis]